MRPSRPAPLLVTVVLLLAACAAYGPTPSTAPSTSVAATPGYTTGPSGTPIGAWSLTLVGGPIAGGYQGQDEMICVGIPGDPSAPVSIVLQPRSASPLQQIDATSSEGGHIFVIGGGIETAANYRSEMATVLEARIDADGVVHLSVEGSQQYPGEPTVRQMSFVGTCPLFPPETDG